MAPTQPVRLERDKRIKSILSFASDLEPQLPTAITSRTAPILLQKIEEQLSSFPTKPIPAAGPKSVELDAQGTSLWNLCTRLRRSFDSEKLDELPPILLVARVFAFYLLDCAYVNGKSKVGSLTRLMKVGIKAAKNAIEQNQNPRALQVLEKVGGYEEVLIGQKGAALPRDEHDACLPLLAEYYIVRTALAWKTEQYNIAEHMFNKATSSSPALDAQTAESLADVLYEMGKDLLNKTEFKDAIKWLDRAYQVLTSHEIDRVSMDAGELRVAIRQSIIKALLGRRELNDIIRARELIDTLENEVGGKLIVLLLRLEIITISSDGSFDGNSYSDVLHRMIRSLVISDDNLKLLLFHIRKLHEKNSQLAIVALDQLITLRILMERKQEHVEKTLVTRLYMISGQRDGEEEVAALARLFDLIYTDARESLSAGACLAAHTLLWKRIESNFTSQNYEDAGNWCKLAMHPLFAKSGEVNMARISRKLLLCALERQDLSNARQIFATMSEATRNEPATRFLMYKLANRCCEIELAAECLQIISSSPSVDQSLLYACCLDAQKVGDKRQTLAALQVVIEKHDYTAPGSVHLPSLLRLTISLMVSNIKACKPNESSFEHEADIAKLCTIFEAGVKSLQRWSKSSVKSSEVLWTVLELDWFSKNSYNIAIENVAIFSPRHTLQMLKCCIAFINHFPSDVGEQVSGDLALRKMFCEFTSSTALVALARAEDNIELQLQDYLELRNHVESFDNILQDRMAMMEEVVVQDLVQKLSILITFDFEAACRLKAWDQLGEVILKSETCKTMRIYQLMADCLLCAQAPTQVVVNTMKKVINAAWSLEEVDLDRLAKYTRCLFQIAIIDDQVIAEELLDQVHSHAEEASQTEQPYPREELEWVATTAFNYAVDLYCAERDEEAKSWAHKAVNIAHHCEDGGALESLLQEKLVGLRFDAKNEV